MARTKTKQNALTVGHIYRNKKNGVRYRCAKASKGVYEMVNIVTGYIFNAGNITIHKDGTIEWGFADGGHYEI